MRANQRFHGCAARDRGPSPSDAGGLPGRFGSKPGPMAVTVSDSPGGASAPVLMSDSFSLPSAEKTSEYGSQAGMPSVQTGESVVISVTASRSRSAPTDQGPD